MSFKNLLEQWQATPEVRKSPSRYQIRLEQDDAARVEALAELFPGIDAETVISDLLAVALREIEAAMPYEAGTAIIQRDEFGDPIYEDIGLTPRYAALLRQRRDAPG